MTVVGLLYDLLIGAGILLAGLGLGWLALRPLRLGEPGLLGLWLAATAGLGLLSWLTLLLGSFGLYRAPFFAAIVAALSAAGLWALGGGLQAHLAAGGPFARGVSGARSWPEAVGYVLLLLLAAGSLLWILLVHGLMPPTEWDTIAYHLAIPRLYIEAQGLIPIPYILQSNWPMQFEMLYTIALLLGSDVAAQLIGWACLALIALGLLLLGRRHLDDRVGAIAAALFLTAPLVKRVGGAGLIDAAMGLYTLGATLAFEVWRRQRRAGWLILCGAFCGMAAGSKLTGGGVALLFGLLVLWEELRRWLAARPGRAPGAVLIRSAMRSGLIVALAGAALVGPWYLRSYLNTGNPIWPFGYALFGGRDWDALGDEYFTQLMYDLLAEDPPRSLAGAAQVLALAVTDPEALGGYRGGLGALLPLGALLALTLVRWAPPLVRHSLWAGGGFYLLWFFLSSLQLRFLLPVAPQLALATAWACGRLLDWLRQPAAQALAVAAIVAAIAPEWPWTRPGERALFSAREPYLTGQQSREAFLDAHVDAMPLFRYANAELPPDARLLLLPWETRGYYLDRSYIWGNVIGQRVIRFEQHESAEELLRTLQGLGVSHILENPNLSLTGLRYWEQSRALMLDLEARCAEPLFRHGEGAILALRDSCRPGALSAVR